MSATDEEIDAVLRQVRVTAAGLSPTALGKLSKGGGTPTKGQPAPATIESIAKTKAERMILERELGYKFKK